MPLSSSAKIRILEDNLRIRFLAPGDIYGLRALFLEVSSGATRFVEITGNGYEGGSASGQIVLERLEYLDAVQRLLREMDPTLDAAFNEAPASTFADFRGGFLQN
jgi:hypothetical protein